MTIVVKSSSVLPVLVLVKAWGAGREQYDAASSELRASLTASRIDETAI